MNIELTLTNIFILISVVVSLGIIGVIVLLLNEQIAGRKLNKKVATLEEANELLTKELLALKNKGSAVSPHRIAEFIDKIKLKDIMSTNVVSIKEDAPFIDVPRKMREYDIRHLPVVSANGYLVGIITERMLYKIRSPRLLESGEWYYDDDMLHGIILRNVMQKEVLSLHEDLSMGAALVKMAETKIGCIPIIGTHNNLIGVVTRKDILKALASLYLVH